MFIKIPFITICIIAFLSTPGLAQWSATANISATIVNSIEFSKVEDMTFKTKMQDSSYNKINPGFYVPALRSYSTSIIETKAEFCIGDMVSNHVSITVTSTPINFNKSGGKVILCNLKNDFENQHTLENGKKLIKIKGELYIDPTAKAGLYRNFRDMVVVINYN